MRRLWMPVVQGDPLSHSFCRGKCCAIVRHNLIASALHRSTRVRLPPTTRPADFMWQVVSSDNLVGIFHAAPISRRVTNSTQGLGTDQVTRDEHRPRTHVVAAISFRRSFLSVEAVSVLVR